MAPLSIAHLFSHTAVTRGGAIQGLLLARALQEHGHRVVTFFHAPDDADDQELADAFDHASTHELDIRRIDMKRRASSLHFRR